MAITNGFKKTKKYRKLSDGNYQLQSEWTSSQTVQMDNGKTLEEQMANLNVSDVSNSTVTYTQASNRTNITTGEKLSVAFGKIKKYFADLKTVAFTGSYTDLSSKPSIPTVTNNLLATNSGTALDAVQGKAINDKIGTTDISAIGDGTVTGALNTLNSNLKIEDITSKCTIKDGITDAKILKYGKIVFIYCRISCTGDISYAIADLPTTREFLVSSIYNSESPYNAMQSSSAWIVRSHLDIYTKETLSKAYVTLGYICW